MARSEDGPGRRARVVYIGGFGRSGSTLLERVLGGIPGWVNVGELVDLPRSVAVHGERCGCGERFFDCPLWTAVGDRAFGGWSPDVLRRLADLRLEVARQRRLPSLLALARGAGRGSRLAGLVAEYQDGYGRLYRAVSEVSGARVVVDASKGPAHGLALALNLARPGADVGADTTGARTDLSGSPTDAVAGSPANDVSYDVSMVNLVRDPRGVAYSWSHRRQTRPQAGTAREQMWSISPARSAVQWAALQSEMHLVGAVAGVPTARLRYEDLVASPRPAVTGLLAELGLPHDVLGHVGDHTVTLQPSHGLSGNPSRFDSGRLELTADDRWQRGLPARERRLVTAITLPWLLAYGYPLAAAEAAPADLAPVTSREGRR